MYGLIIMYFFEALTNWRIPLIVSRLRFGKENIQEIPVSPNCRINIDAERLQRLVLAIFLYVTVVVFPDQAWFGPWFMALVLLIAGLTNVCVSVVFLRHLGFR